MDWLTEHRRALAAAHRNRLESGDEQLPPTQRYSVQVPHRGVMVTINVVAVDMVEAKRMALEVLHKAEAALDGDQSS